MGHCSKAESAVLWEVSLSVKTNDFTSLLKKRVCVWVVQAVGGGVIANITGYTPSQPHSDLRISLFHIQLITARRPSSSLINRDAEHKHILSSPSGCRWRRLVLIPISHQLPLITHSGIHHHGNYCTCYGWLSRQPGWIIVPVLLWCAASPPLAWLTRSCDVRITARNACCG